MKTVLIITLLILTKLSLANNCLKTRAAFDIGSGATKLKVAKVDICKQLIVKILLDEERAVGYKQDLKDSTNNHLSINIIKLGIDKILELKKEAQKYFPESYIAVATSAFRTASNGQQAAQSISRNTGVSIHIISQEQEAKIGFAGATVVSGVDLTKTIVWDIGGGSMQITSYQGNGKYNIYQGKLASVSFKNYFIEEIKKQNSKRNKTPNPISKRQYKKGQRDAEIFAKMSVSDEIKKSIMDSSKVIVGIGGVHYHSISKNLDKKIYQVDDLEAYIKKHLNLSDSELGGDDYVDTKLTNFILASAFMKGLKIKEVIAGKVNMANGLLIAPELAK